MEALLLMLARVAGFAGVLVSAFAVLARLFGMYAVFGFEARTLLLAGIAALVVACFGYLAVLAEFRRIGSAGG